MRLRFSGSDVGGATAAADGIFSASFSVPPVEPGRYELTANCGPELAVPLDVVLASSVSGGSSLAVLVFFILVGVGLWQFRRAL